MGLELRAGDIGSGAFVVDHVLWSEADIAVQVGGRLVYRQTELLHQVASVHISLPKQPKLDELETLRYPPTKLRLVAIHFALPILRVGRPFLASRRPISLSKVTRTRAPEAPIG